MNEPVVVLGGGLAGLATALALAPLPVLLVSAAPLERECSSAWAQGGIAAAVGTDDSVALHVADTLAAGDGLCDADAVGRIVSAGPALIGWLEACGVVFDREAGALRLRLEAAHGRRRIVHAGDATGAAVTSVLAARVRGAGHVRVLEGRAAARLVVAGGAVRGVWLADGTGIAARAVVLATGGVGGLFPHTTNPRGAWGQGLLMAAEAGAALRDLEFVQFHPTALDAGGDPMALVSEAVRGEGAVLVDEDGTRFMAGYARGELEPRDVVSRAVWGHLQAGHRVFLDARECLGDGFAARFPTVAGLCRAAGIDPAREAVPVRPAAHYHMGGVAAAADGTTGVAGLHAVGEVCCTGLHGANRLASNSLLEAGVQGGLAAAAIKGGVVAVRGVVADCRAFGAVDVGAVRAVIGRGVGVLRNEAGLAGAEAGLRRLVEAGGAASGPATVGLMMVVAARRRRESRGAHFRTDFPDAAAVAAHSLVRLADVLPARVAA